MFPPQQRSQRLYGTLGGRVAAGVPWRSTAGKERAREGEVPLFQSPARLLILLAVSIFFGETCVMLVLHLFPEPPPMIEALLDSCMLLVVVSPTLYFFLFRPFMHHLRLQQQSEEEVRALSRRLMVASEQERRRVAIDLHDDFGQILTSLHLRLQRMNESLAPQGGGQREQLLDMIATVRELSDDIRRYAACLRPAIIDDLGLVPALEWLLAEQRKHHPELRIDLRCLGVRQQPPARIAEAIYRICQEALNNVVKYANAHRVDVTLIHSHPKLILTVRDDGEGFVVPAVGQGGVGLWSMRERAALAGGALQVTSSLGGGTLVRAELPWAAAMIDADEQNQTAAG